MKFIIQLQQSDGYLMYLTPNEQWTFSAKSAREFRTFDICKRHRDDMARHFDNPNRISVITLQGMTPEQAVFELMSI